MWQRLVSVSLGCLVLAMVSAVRAEEHATDSLDKVLQAVKDKKAILIDVREKLEWDRGHLKEAKLLPLSVLKNGSASTELGKAVPKDLSKDTIIYVHCASGYRCLEAAPLIRKQGYETRALPAGYKELLKSGFTQAPADKPSTP